MHLRRWWRKPAESDWGPGSRSVQRSLLVLGSLWRPGSRPVSGADSTPGPSRQRSPRNLVDEPEPVRVRSLSLTLAPYQHQVFAENRPEQWAAESHRRRRRNARRRRATGTSVPAASSWFRCIPRSRSCGWDHTQASRGCDPTGNTSDRADDSRRTTIQRHPSPTAAALFGSVRRQMGARVGTKGWVGTD